MTNEEYERSCVSSVDIASIARIDNTIIHYENQLRVLQEQRREIINRYNLNKCSHEWDFHPSLGASICIKCGDKL